jgi:glutamate synthase domain-containing protein 2/glutamate synthase domain-containing protein 1/glutamate synthase domain-containing protein 3
MGHDACGIGFVADLGGGSSRWLMESALTALARVRHRGAVAADARTSDGTGVLTPIPTGLYGPPGSGVAMLFTTPGTHDPTQAVQDAAWAEGITVTSWRTPPVDDRVLGDLARQSMPEVRQAILARPADPMGRPFGDDAAEQAAVRMRRRLRLTAPGTYVVSLSFRTINHKGLIAADSLADFWLDLADDRFVAPFAVFHQRFSTNTLPSWERAQPFRTLCHNGEVNTITANANRMVGRGVLGTEASGLGDEELFRPVLDSDDSDSGMLDDAAGLLVAAGRTAPHAMAMLVPAAWEHSQDLDPDVRGFYAYHSALVEPWDGPAGVVFTDGVGVGACLDRNGLRPLRWMRCDDGLVVCASEAGVVDTAGHGRVQRGRLGPGKMLWCDPTTSSFEHDRDIKTRLASAAPYARWATDGLYQLSDTAGNEQSNSAGAATIVEAQVCHGYTREELAMVLRPMASEAHEPTFSMGDDTALPHMAQRPRPVHHYLRQRFAQVTNPPIDSLRERSVMSTRTLLGPRSPLLTQHPGAARLLELPSFIAYPATVARLHDPGANPFGVTVLDATFDATHGPTGLVRRVDELAAAAHDAVSSGIGIVVVDNGGIGPDHIPVPGLLAVGAVNQVLVTTGLRERCSIVAVCDDVRDVHAVATVVGHGADVVCPRLALITVSELADASDNDDLVGPEAQQRLRAALEVGVLKVMSKMGIATVDSYRGAGLFDSVGLAAEVVDACFGDTACTIGGVGWHDLGADALANHQRAFGDAEPELDSPGFIRVRAGGEAHGKSKDVVEALNEVAAAHILQSAIRSQSSEQYTRFAELVARRPPLEPHDLLELVASSEPVPLDEVEPATAIVQRFTTGAMSHGALSAEAHETLARAMNLLGAGSNCGEGGEDPSRFRTRGQGRDDRNSRTKQVASGRFGVTPEYLAFADELQIKMAQGSKPGEGGQLPGHKVTAEIARLRHTQPGVGLISPPPHHDIYSIEDLAQLIFDLKQVNAAEVSVKLVATDGVGTIAAGVAKALADTVHISGANGGTGASPLSSIKHAGMPWELGLAETQQALMANGLRHRVRICVDGGLLTGRQVAVAAALGADAFSFGTAAMIAEGCIMLRACHRDTCKPGIATQRPNLRANFTGTPEGVAAYFMFVANEVRGLLASLGLRTMDELVGRTDLVTQRTTGDQRIDSTDLSALLAVAGPTNAVRSFTGRLALQDPRSTLGDLIAAEAFRPVWDGDHIEVHHDITTADRAVGAALGGAIALEFGTAAPPGSATVHLTGSAGQSLGAFITEGIDIRVVGEANDYVGKGMGGGRIVVTPPGDDASIGVDDLTARPAVLAGNTCLYGATGGQLWVAGAVGERFAVRNSGALAVVEATGDHCCEYMTGGVVVVLGSVGHNMGAGMTGGHAFVFEPRIDRLAARVNRDLVQVRRPHTDTLDEVRWMVEMHHDLTGSARSGRLLSGWDQQCAHVWEVVPRGTAERMAAETSRRVTAA